MLPTVEKRCHIERSEMTRTTVVVAGWADEGRLALNLATKIVKIAEEFAGATQATKNYKACFPDEYRQTLECPQPDHPVWLANKK
jgi:hypothetical protein